MLQDWSPYYSIFYMFVQSKKITYRFGTVSANATMLIQQNIVHQIYC